MENFICKKIEKNTKYEYIFYSTSYKSSIMDKSLLLELIKKFSIKGYILIDLLLSKGNTFNRFVEIYVENGNMKTIKVQKDVDIFIKNESLKFYYKHRYLLDKKNSIFSF